jgi:hypothetical protein
VVAFGCVDLINAKSIDPVMIVLELTISANNISEFE